MLVFSFFEDTVKWIRDFLELEVTRRPELAPYQNRLIAVSDSGDLEEVSRQRARGLPQFQWWRRGTR